MYEASWYKHFVQLIYTNKSPCKTISWIIHVKGNKDVCHFADWSHWCARKQNQETEHYKSNVSSLCGPF
jgi:hypothetical protein